MLKVILFLCLVNYSVSQKAGLGTCPDVTTVTNLDVKKFSGTWYVQYETNSFIGLGIRCETHDYKTNSDGTLTDYASATGFLMNPKWHMTLNRTDPTNSAKWSSSIPMVPFSTPYWITGTDYTSYATIWSCSDMMFVNAQFSWILTRERHPSDEVLSTARNVLEKNNLDVTSLRRDTQSDCSN